MRAIVQSGFTGLSATRRTALELIKRRGEASVDQIAAVSGVSTQAARQHLTALERDGLVRHREQKNGQGRPRHLYTLTPQGDDLFPRRYEDLTNELLGYVQDEDPALLTRIFDRRAQRRLQNTRARTDGLRFPERVRAIARILDEDGYLADFEERPDGSFLITERNCAVLSVALRHGHACSSELEYLAAAMPEAEVTRIAHRIAGGHVCAYHIVPRSQAPGAGAI